MPFFSFGKIPYIVRVIAVLEVVNVYICKKNDFFNKLSTNTYDLDLIAEADWIIDLGPEGDNNGGQLVAAGAPPDVIRAGTHTGRAIEGLLKRQTAESAHSVTQGDKCQ